MRSAPAIRSPLQKAHVLHGSTHDRWQGHRNPVDAWEGGDTSGVFALETAGRQLNRAVLVPPPFPLPPGEGQGEGIRI